MPLFYGDFLTSTREWPGEARSLYLTLLAEQWVNPEHSLPADPESLRAMVGWDGETFRRYWPLVSRKFSVTGARLVNQRAEEHRARSVAISEERSIAGRKGAEARRKQKSQQTAGKSEAIAKTNGSKPQAIASDVPSKQSANEGAIASKKPANAGDLLKHPSYPSYPSSPSLSNPSGESSGGSESEAALRAREEPDAASARARARRNGDAQRRATRRISGGLKKTNGSGGEDETRRKALTLLGSGMGAGDVARMLAQYGVTAEQVSAWQREEAQA